MQKARGAGDADTASAPGDRPERPNFVRGAIIGLVIVIPIWLLIVVMVLRLL